MTELSIQPLTTTQKPFSLERALSYSAKFATFFVTPTFLYLSIQLNSFFAGGLKIIYREHEIKEIFVKNKEKAM